MEALLTLHTKYAELVQRTFSNDKVFVEALDKVYVLSILRFSVGLNHVVFV